MPTPASLVLLTTNASSFSIEISIFSEKFIIVSHTSIYNSYHYIFILLFNPDLIATETCLGKNHRHQAVYYVYQLLQQSQKHSILVMAPFSYQGISFSLRITNRWVHISWAIREFEMAQYSFQQCIMTMDSGICRGIRLQRAPDIQSTTLPSRSISR